MLLRQVDRVVDDMIRRVDHIWLDSSSRRAADSLKYHGEHGPWQNRLFLIPGTEGPTTFAQFVSLGGFKCKSPDEPILTMTEYEACASHGNVEKQYQPSHKNYALSVNVQRRVHRMNAALMLAVEMVMTSFFLRGDVSLDADRATHWFSNGLYLAGMVATSVGYGDFAPYSSLGAYFSPIWMSILVGTYNSIFTDDPLQRSALDCSFIKGLFSSSQDASSHGPKAEAESNSGLEDSVNVDNGVDVKLEDSTDDLTTAVTPVVRSTAINRQFGETIHDQKKDHDRLAGLMGKTRAQRLLEAGNLRTGKLDELPPLKDRT